MKAYPWPIGREPRQSSGGREVLSYCINSGYEVRSGIVSVLGIVWTWRFCRAREQEVVVTYRPPYGQA